MVGIGMLFNYQKYSEFDVNIFDYADVFDFLIAPFSDLYIVLFATLSMLFVFLFIAMDTLWKNKRPVSYSRGNFGLDKKSWFPAYRTGLFVFTVVLYLYISADYYGRYARNKVMNTSDVSVRFSDDQVKQGKLIGKTKDVIFIYEDGSVFALPFDSSVKEIRIK